MKDIAANGKTIEILKKHNLYFKKNFGQNFIIDPSVVVKIAENSCDENLITLEIGPGIGALTQQLLRRSKKVYAYEIDTSLIDVLNENLSEFNNLELINQDFLKADLNFLAGQEIVVCANLPYYITTAILFKLFESGLNIKSINVMMQKEVGDRLLAKENDENYAALSVIVQYSYEVKKMMKVAKEVFMPKPNVDSVVLSLIPKKQEDDIDKEAFFEFVKQCFNQRRKTLSNNLKSICSKEKLVQLESFNLKRRAQELSLKEFLELFKAYES